MNNQDNFDNETPLLSVIVIDSRSDNHPDWVNTSIKSVEAQDIPIEMIVVNNIGRKHTIGKCWNIGVKQANCDWVVMIGDDDYINFDYCRTLNNWINDVKNRGSNVVNVATYMTFFENETGKRTFKAQQSTGAWRKDYLLQYPFNEELKSGVDREYIEESIKRGSLALLIEYYFGYYYRKFPKDYDYSCAGEVTFIEKPRDYFFCTSNRIFLDSITKRFKKTVGEENIMISPNADSILIDKAKVIWVEWANEKAVEIQNASIDAYKILRLHAYEAFSDTIKKLDLNKFDKVIFIDHYIKDYVERQYGKVKGAVVIPNGVEVDRYKIEPNKQRNNKIAFAGYLTRKKGIGELVLLAESFPEYEFHLAGRYQEDDIADYFNHKMPKNVFMNEWKYDTAMDDFYKDKSFILNTSLRESQGMTIMEGMACGLSPLIRGWIGSDEVYKKEWIYNSIEDFRRLLENPIDPEECRKFVVDNYSIDNIYPKLEELLLNEVKV